MKSTRIDSLLFVLVFGGIFVVVGGLVMAVSLNVIPSSDANFHAPRLVVAAAGAVFCCGGMAVILQAAVRAGWQETAWGRLLQSIFIFGILFLIAAIFIWVGFGPGERAAFQVESSSGGTGTLPEFTGRLLYGSFGVVILLITLAALVFKRKFMTKKPAKLPENDPFAGDTL